FGERRGRAGRGCRAAGRVAAGGAHGLRSRGVDRLEAPGQPRARRAWHRAPAGRALTVRLAVLGGGSWGTALGAHLVRAGHEVRLWVREGSIADEINARHSNGLYLPGVALPEALAAGTELPKSVEGAQTL